MAALTDGQQREGGKKGRWARVAAGVLALVVAAAAVTAIALAVTTGADGAAARGVEAHGHLKGSTDGMAVNASGAAGAGGDVVGAEASGDGEEVEETAAEAANFVPRNKTWLWLGYIESIGVNAVHLTHAQVDRNGASVKRGVEWAGFGIMIFASRTYIAFLEVLADFFVTALEWRDAGQPVLGLEHATAFLIVLVVAPFPFAAMMEDVAEATSTFWAIVLYLAVHGLGFAASSLSWFTGASG